MSSQICLKWNSFLSNIATSFESLWEEEGLVDVTLTSDGQCLTAHKVILSASSPFFKKVFQTNPCQHPVIILQDVHFTELEALLIFIYKGEVNIEQKNLPALLKAAETLQIRGLSGGDIFAKESYKRLIESERIAVDDEVVVESNDDETPKKKQKVAKSPNNSILEKALTPGASRAASVSESSGGDGSHNDDDESHSVCGEQLPNPVYQRLEMKIEPFDVTLENLHKNPEVKEELQRFDAEQEDESPVDRTIAGSSRSGVTVIAEARDICVPSRGEPKMAEPEVPITAPNEREEDDSNGKFSESLNVSLDRNPGMSSHEAYPTFSDPGNAEFSEETQTTTTTATKGGQIYPPFPCPFCDRAYTSWGFRRRHIKAVHTISPKLNCKWCLQVLPTHAAWRRHVISAHNLSASDAHNGLLILEEAHMVLQIAHPTRLDTLVNIIKQSSQRNNAVADSEPRTD